MVTDGTDSARLMVTGPTTRGRVHLEEPLLLGAEGQKGGASLLARCHRSKRARATPPRPKRKRPTGAVAVAAHAIGRQDVREHA